LAVIFEQLCHGVGAAHALGIVHRDLKPENIFLARSRAAGARFIVKVLDFGIAKIVSEVRARTTEAMGTPLWMAPEQTARGAAISPQTDVWALGLIAFFCLTGHLYWRSGEGEGASVQRVLRELLVDDLVSASARAHELGIRLPHWFDSWFRRCVHREPQARFQNANAAGAALRQCIDGLRPDASSVAQTLSPPEKTLPDRTVPMTVAPTERRGGHAQANGGEEQANAPIAPRSVPAPAPLSTGMAGDKSKALPAPGATESDQLLIWSILAVLIVVGGVLLVGSLNVGKGAARSTEGIPGPAGAAIAAVPCLDPKTDAERRARLLTNTPLTAIGDIDGIHAVAADFGDLNGDGRSEFTVIASWLYRVGNSKFRQIELTTTIITSDSNGCARDVVTEAPGEALVRLESRTNGWRDLKFLAWFNWQVSNQTCSASLRAQFDGETYRMVRVESVGHYLSTGSRANLEQCRAQAESLLAR
jgi:hypothetical protein